MGCCSSAPRSLVIETTVLRVEGDTCERCGETVEAARSAVKDLQTVLLPLNVRVTLVEHAATTDEIDASNSVVINGRPIEEWLGGKRVGTDCPSCGDLLGESTCCGAMEIDGVVRESVSVDQIRDAAFAALGTDDVGGCC